MKIIDSKLKFSGNLTKRTATNDIFTHHAAAQHCTVQDVHAWHLAKKYYGIGYHFFIAKNGNIYAGRPDNTIGAHAKGSNSYSIGICFEGDYQDKDKVMPAAQLKAGVELVNYLKKKYNITSVKKHSDVCATSCPGKYFPFEEIAYGKIKEEIAHGNIEEKCPYTRPEATIKKGSKGDDVRWLQWHLNKWDYNLSIDGSCGPATVEAIKDFQAKNGLEVDGRCGPATKAKVEIAYGNIEEECPYKEPVSTAYLGVKGSEVKWLQWQLNRNGYNLEIDGSCGPATVEAIKDFQAKNGLEVDGRCGPATRKELK